MGRGTDGGGACAAQNNALAHDDRFICHDAPGQGQHDLAMRACPDRGLGLDQGAHFGQFLGHALDAVARFDVEAQERLGVGGPKIKAPIRK